MLAPRSLIAVWGPPSAVVDEVTGDVAINIGGVVIETVSRAYDARQKLADEAGDVSPRVAEHVVVNAIVPPPDKTPRQLGEIPTVEPMGPAANMSRSEPEAKDQQIPSPPADEEHVTTQDVDTARSKKTILSKLLGSDGEKRPSKAPPK